MNKSLQYRDINYFNITDTYLIFTSSGQFITTKIHFHDNGYWYSNNKSNNIVKDNDRLQYKMTTIMCINCNELI